MSTIDISLTHKDIGTIRRLRECLKNQSVNLVLIDELLTTLEGKIKGPSNGKQKKTNHKDSRVARHVQRLLGDRVPSYV